jgi:hypothetical protein
MMMEASPSAAFVVAKPDLLLEFLIIAFDAPLQRRFDDDRVDGSLEEERKRRGQARPWAQPARRWSRTSGGWSS